MFKDRLDHFSKFIDDGTYDEFDRLAYEWTKTDVFSKRQFKRALELYASKVHTFVPHRCK